MINGINELSFTSSLNFQGTNKQNINPHIEHYKDILQSNRELSKELIKLSTDEHSISSFFNKINKEKINSLTKKIIEMQDKGEMHISDQDKEFIKEAKCQLMNLKSFLIDDIINREAFIAKLIEDN